MAPSSTCSSASWKPCRFDGVNRRAASAVVSSAAIPPSSSFLLTSVLLHIGVVDEPSTGGRTAIRISAQPRRALPLFLGASVRMWPAGMSGWSLPLGPGNPSTLPHSNPLSGSCTPIRSPARRYAATSYGAPPSASSTTILEHFGARVTLNGSSIIATGPLPSISSNPYLRTQLTAASAGSGSGSPHRHRGGTRASSSQVKAGSMPPYVLLKHATSTCCRRRGTGHGSSRYSACTRRQFCSSTDSDGGSIPGIEASLPPAATARCADPTADGPGSGGAGAVTAATGPRTRTVTSGMVKSIHEMSSPGSGP
mmetsp:Transcript_11576/g.34889  ORF Transcript_11576/g.34889 Transcript_11576/m.34889 type:complete len:310 (-) Transcript_11576:1490-2419(-)